MNLSLPEWNLAFWPCRPVAFPLLAGISLVLFSSCRKHQVSTETGIVLEKGFKNNLEFPDSVVPSQVTIIANLPDSLQPETMLLANSPAPLKLPNTNIPVSGILQYKEKQELVSIDPPAKTNVFYSPDLQHYTAEQGLALDAVTCSYTDKKGNLWFGTHVGGVSKYDGKSFTSYTTTSGLLNNTVSDIIEDRHGNMLFASGQGICKFDGSKFSFIGQARHVLSFLEDKAGNIWAGTHRHGLYKITGDSLIQFSEPDELARAIIFVIREDKHGIIYIGCDLGIYRYDGKNFLRLHLNLESVEDIVIDQVGNIWAGHKHGLTKFDGQHTIHFPFDPGVKSVFEDRFGNIIAGTGRDGVWCYNKDLTHPLYKLIDINVNDVQCMSEDHSGNLWFGTNGNGVYKYSGKAFQQVVPNSIRSILEDKSGTIWFSGYYTRLSNFDGSHITHFGPDITYWSLLQDNSGSLWLGSEATGLIKFDQQEFTFYNDLHGLPGETISSLAQDTNGNLWIGTLKDLCQFNGSAFTTFSKKQGLPSNRVNYILEHKPGHLLIATDSGLSVFDGISFSNYSISALPAGNDIRSMKKDQYDNIWMGSYGGGLTRYDGKTFQTYTVENGLPDNVLTQVALTREGNIMVGTNAGIGLLTGFTSVAGTESGNPMSSDKMGQFPAQNNLSNKELHHHTPVFEIYNPKTGYPVTDVNRGQNAILPDSKGFVWIASGSAKSGLMRFDYSSLRKNRNPPHLNILSVKVDNELISWNTLLKNEFDSQLTDSQPALKEAPAFLTEEVGTFGKKLSDAQRKEMKSKYKGLKFDSIRKFYPVPENLVLPYRHNNITIDFAAIEPDKPSLVQYQYKLEGYDEIWSSPANVKSASFGNMNEGTYHFQLKAKSPSGIWSEPVTYTFTVLPPAHRTWWAYTLYVMLFGTIMYTILFLMKRRMHLRHQRKVEQDETIRLKELDHFKSKLYTNLTHEFRTPLTVILGMAKQLSSGNWNTTVAPKEKTRISQGLTMIENNGRNLLQLINQLLDLSKLENNSFKLQNIQGDIVPYVRYVSESFHSYAEDLGLTIRFESDLKELIMDFDPEQLKQILTNLISNALKFTSPGGEIIITLYKTSNQLYMDVIDTGIGIAEKDLPHIMDRFYQADNSSTRSAEGTGIGLAHTQELVKVMGGSIAVQSALGKGTTITVQFPITHEATILEQEDIATPTKPHLSITRTPSEAVTDSTSSNDQQPALVGNIPELLIIEDNHDVVEYLRSCLESTYQIEVAYNGKAGVEKAVERIPDFIISDVMMPEMDGFQVCDKLKNDERTSHIPIILLTAKADASSRLTGLRRGADAYMAKPFSPEELSLQISTLLENRRRMAAYFSRGLKEGTLQVPIEPSAPEAIIIEDAFMKKVNAIIEAHYMDEQFSLPELAQEINMSRSQLLRKIKAIANNSPSELIRTYRLKKAKVILETEDVSVSEAAYRVGFKDPSYFSKLFLEEFGVLPRALKN